MAEALSSYDKLDYPKHHLGDWEAPSIHKADPKRAEDREYRSSLDEHTHSRPLDRDDGPSSASAGIQDLNTPTPTPHYQARSRMIEPSAYYTEEPRKIERDECEAIKRYSTIESQGHPASSTSGSTTSSSIESQISASSLRSPRSSTSTVAEPSKPVVRFSDRGPPRATAKRPSISRRSSGNGVSALEWGVLFDEDGYATPRNGQFLRGLARYIIENFALSSSNLVITPEKLVVLYSRYRLDLEFYPFLEIFTSKTKDFDDRIADFFDDLNCEYHLVKPDAYSRPRVPALTPDGFATYITTCILANPEEEFRRLDRIVSDVQIIVDVPHPHSVNADSQPLEKLPRQLIRSQFPVRHDTKSRKVLETALDDLVYDLGILVSSRPKSPLAIMPPPPPPPANSERRSSDPKVIRYTTRNGHVVPATRDRDRGRYHEHGHYAEDHAEKRHSFPAASPRASQAGPFTIAAATSGPSTAPIGVNSVDHSYHIAASNSNANTGADTSIKKITYRRAHSPPTIRRYRASAPDVSNSASTAANYSRSAGYAPVSAVDRKEAMGDGSSSSSHNPNTVSGPRGSTGSNVGLWSEAGPPNTMTSTSVSGRRNSGSGKAASPSSTASTFGSVSSSSLTATPQSNPNTSHKRQDSTGRIPTAVTMNIGEKKQHSHHHHHRRRSVVVAAEDNDRGPTWEEVLKGQTQPSSHHHNRHRRTGSNGGSSSHHHRHHSNH